MQMKRHRFTNIRGTAHVVGSTSGGPYKSKLERDAFICSMMNRSVVRVTLQKPHVTYSDSSGGTHRYTGDQLIEYHPACNRKSKVVECKYQQELRNDPTLEIKHEQVQKVLEKNGLDFEVWTEADVYKEDFAMVKFVYEHRNLRPHPATSEVLSYVTSRPGVELKEMLDALRSTWIEQLQLVPEVWRLVGCHKLIVDLRETLGLQTKLMCPGPLVPFQHTKI
jgi:hypothetical protein